MPRCARFSIPGIPWHLIQRGNNRSVCFYAEEDHDLTEPVRLIKVQPSLDFPWSGYEVNVCVVFAGKRGLSPIVPIVPLQRFFERDAEMANWYLTSFVVIAFLGFAGAFGIVVWLNGLIPMHIKKKYAWVVLMKCKFPFFQNWEKNIDIEDIVVFKRYRKILLAWYASAAIILILEFLIWQKMIAVQS